MTLRLPTSARIFGALCLGALTFGATARAQAAPARVELRQDGGQWQLFVNHKPFYIKGAGLDAGHVADLAKAGGNSLRNWSADHGKAILDEAAAHGLYVTMGLDVARERHGFNYSDPAVVAAQLARLQGQVLALKDHPALLMWDIGNELNLNATNPKVWDAVNDISKMIHRLDPNHLTTTSLAGANKGVVAEIKARAPDLDLLCFQSYADIVNLPRELRECEWTGPYVVTEWGATGHWECGKTAWGAPIEDNSSRKADLYMTRYKTAIAADSKKCLGSYVFLWGQKEERTPTWYGMFLSDGQATETIDVMQYLWTGDWPGARCPRLDGLWLAGQTAPENVRLTPTHSYTARVQAHSSAHTPLSYTWEIVQETSAHSVGGDYEPAPVRMPGLIAEGAGAEAHLRAPAEPGAYRLLVYVSDQHGKAAYANIPFYVDAQVARATGQP
jgi:hypothetical protein